MYRPELVSAPIYGQFHTLPGHVPETTPLPITKTPTTARAAYHQPLTVSPYRKERTKNKYSFKIVKSEENDKSTTNTLSTMSLPV